MRNKGVSKSCSSKHSMGNLSLVQISPVSCKLVHAMHCWCNLEVTSAENAPLAYSAQLDL